MVKRVGLVTSDQKFALSHSFAFGVRVLTTPEVRDSSVVR